MESEETSVCSSVDFEGIVKFKSWLDSSTKLGAQTKLNYLSTAKRIDAKTKGIYTFENVMSFLKKSDSPATRSALNYWLAFLGLNDILKQLPELSRNQPRPREIPTYAEFVQVIALLPDEERNIAKFLLYTGARCHEAFEAKFGDIDWDSGRINIESSKGGGKGFRTIELPPEFTIELKKYLAEEKGLLNNDRIFYSQSKGSLQTKVKEFYKKLNLTAFRVLNKKIGTHDFRRSYATFLYKQTGDLQLVNRLMGHSRLDTTLVYTRFATQKEDIDRAKKLLEDREK